MFREQLWHVNWMCKKKKSNSKALCTCSSKPFGTTLSHTSWGYCTPIFCRYYHDLRELWLGLRTIPAPSTKTSSLEAFYTHSPGTVSSRAFHMHGNYGRGKFRRCNPTLHELWQFSLGCESATITRYFSEAFLSTLLNSFLPAHGHVYNIYDYDC